MGILNKKEYRAASILLKPERRPAAIVEPEREIPLKIIAIPWKKPINTAFFTDMEESLGWCCE